MMIVHDPYLSHLRYLLCFVMQPFDYPIKPGCDLTDVKAHHGKKAL